MCVKWSYLERKQVKMMFQVNLSHLQLYFAMVSHVARSSACVNVHSHVNLKSYRQYR